ncbi:MAG: hypothetical protein PVH45_02715, partial [Candidatus Omnitrophota bacterium]
IEFLQSGSYPDSYYPEIHLARGIRLRGGVDLKGRIRSIVHKRGGGNELEHILFLFYLPVRILIGLKGIIDRDITPPIKVKKSERVGAEAPPQQYPAVVTHATFPGPSVMQAGQRPEPPASARISSLSAQQAPLPLPPKPPFAREAPPPPKVSKSAEEAQPPKDRKQEKEESTKGPAKPEEDPADTAYKAAFGSDDWQEMLRKKVEGERAKASGGDTTIKLLSAEEMESLIRLIITVIKGNDSLKDGAFTMDDLLEKASIPLQDASLAVDEMIAHGTLEVVEKDIPRKFRYRGGLSEEAAAKEDAKVKKAPPKEKSKILTIFEKVIEDNDLRTGAFKREDIGFGMLWAFNEMVELRILRKIEGKERFTLRQPYRDLVEFPEKIEEVKEILADLPDNLDREPERREEVRRKLDAVLDEAEKLAEEKLSAGERAKDASPAEPEAGTADEGAEREQVPKETGKEAGSGKPYKVFKGIIVFLKEHAEGKNKPPAGLTFKTGEIRDKAGEEISPIDILLMCQKLAKSGLLEEKIAAQYMLSPKYCWLTFSQLEKLAEDILKEEADNFDQARLTEKLKAFIKKIRKSSGPPRPDPRSSAGGKALGALLMIGGGLMLMGANAPEGTSLASSIALSVFTAALAAWLIYNFFVYLKIRDAKKIYRKYLKGEISKEWVEKNTDYEIASKYNYMYGTYQGLFYTDRESRDYIVVKESVEVRKHRYEFEAGTFKIDEVEYSTAGAKLAHLPLILTGAIFTWTVSFAIFFAYVVYSVATNVYDDNPFINIYKIFRAKKDLPVIVALKKELKRKDLSEKERQEKEEQLKAVKKRWTDRKGACHIEAYDGYYDNLECNATIRITPGLRLFYNKDEENKIVTELRISRRKDTWFCYRARLRNIPVIFAIDLYHFLGKLSKCLDDAIRTIPVIDKKLVIIGKEITRRRKDGDIITFTGLLNALKEKQEAAGKDEKGDILHGFDALVKSFIRKGKKSYKAYEFAREEFQKKRKKSKKEIKKGGKKTYSYSVIKTELDGLVDLGILTVDTDYRPYKYQVDEKYLRGPPKRCQERLDKAREIIESENLPANPTTRRLREVRERIENEVFTEAERAVIIESRQITDRRYRDTLLKDEPIVTAYIELLYKLNLELYSLGIERVYIEDSIDGLVSKLERTEEAETRKSLRGKKSRLEEELKGKKKNIRNLLRRANRQIRNFKKMRYSGPAIKRYENYRGKAKRHFQEAVDLINKEALEEKKVEDFREMMKRAINDLYKDREWLLERRLERKRAAKVVNIQYRQGKYELVEGRYVGKGAPMPKRFRTRYRYLWDAFRATDHKIDSEDENLTWITPVIDELRYVRDALQEREKAPSVVPDDEINELSKKLEAVLKQLKGVKVEEKRLVRITLGAVTRLIKARKLDTAWGLLTKSVNLFEKRRNNVEGILRNIKTGSLTSLRMEAEKRNKDIRGRARRIFRLLRDGGEANRQQALRELRGLKSLRWMLEPEYSGLKNQLLLCVQSVESGEVNMDLISGTMGIVASRADNADVLSGFMEDYRDLHELWLLGRKPALKTEFDVFKFVFQEYLTKADRIRGRPRREEYCGKVRTAPRTFWTRFYQAAFTPFRMDDPSGREDDAGRPIRVFNPAFQAMSDMILIQLIPDFEKIITYLGRREFTEEKEKIPEGSIKKLIKPARKRTKALIKKLSDKGRRNFAQLTIKERKEVAKAVARDYGLKGAGLRTFNRSVLRASKPEIERWKS